MKRLLTTFAATCSLFFPTGTSVFAILSSKSNPKILANDCLSTLSILTLSVNIVVVDEDDDDDDDDVDDDDDDDELDGVDFNARVVGSSTTVNNLGWYDCGSSCSRLFKQSIIQSGDTTEKLSFFIVKLFW